LYYGYIPVSECRAWKKELEERAISKGLLSRKELEGEKPDWEGWFLEWNSKWSQEKAGARKSKRT
jgi:hypothetical protein